MAGCTPLARHRGILGLPGVSFYFGTFTTASKATARHNFPIAHSGSGDNFNQVWCDGLNACEAGEVTHFAMLHADVFCEDGWLDILVAEMEAKRAALCSANVAIKDGRGLNSCGIAHPTNPWRPLRRFTMRDLKKLPATFDAADAGYPGHALLHNNACWVADLRFKQFFASEIDEFLGECAKVFFEYPKRIFRSPKTGRWTVVASRSEDWEFSRKIHALGLPSCITTKVKIQHRGTADFNNWEPWGAWDVDEDNADLWRTNGHAGTTSANEPSRNGC